MLVLYQLQIITGYDNYLKGPSCFADAAFSDKPFPELYTRFGLPYDRQLCVMEDPDRPPDAYVLSEVEAIIYPDTL